MASFDKITSYHRIPHAILELHSFKSRGQRSTVRVIKNSLNETMKKMQKVFSNKASLEPSFVGSIS